MSELEQKEKAAFFALIRADPGNNDTRLVFADWCEEHGDMELAEMLRGGSRQWLLAFIEKYRPYAGPATDDAIRELAEEVQKGHFDAWGTVINDVPDLHPGDEPAFWRHMEVMTGIFRDEAFKQKFTWSCSC